MDCGSDNLLKHVGEDMDTYCYRFFFDDGMTSYLDADDLMQAVETVTEELRQRKHGSAKRVIKVVEIN